MKYSAKRLISVVLALVMIVSVLPINVFAWSNKSHANSANIVLLEAQRSANQNSGNAFLKLYAPYDDHVNGGYSYRIPDEFREAIFAYPEAFRAGSLGPDFYPDIIAGQMVIHPYDDNAGSGEWLEVLCESVNILPKDSAYRKEALAFTLGCMLHYCGDLFGHDFINNFSGGPYPEVMAVVDDILDLNETSANLNNVLSHMSSESYMDSLVNWDFYNKSDYLGVKAPTRFVTDTLIGNGSLFAGHTYLYDEYGELPPHFEWLIDWRTELYNEANEWRDNPDPTLSAAASAYLDRWVEDQDRAIYALTETFDKIAARLVKEKNPSLVDIVTEELKAWGLTYGIYITGIPDVMIDVPMAIDDFLDMIDEAMPDIDFDILPDIDELIEDLIEEAILAYLGLPHIDEVLAKYEQRLKDPSVQLDHKYNPYMKGGDNFAEFKEYMDKYAEEQKILSETTASAIINGNDGGRFDIVLDSDFEAFYNTITMFKLILMGPENFKTFVKELSGKTPSVYNSQKTAYVSATGLEFEITTADLVDAGTDDDIYAVIYKMEDSGKKTQVTKKLLDISYYNDFEAGCKDKYFVELPEPVRVDRIEVSIQQEGNITAGGFWKCEDVTITPVHSGLPLINPVSVGGNNHMDSGRSWHLNFQNALYARNHSDPKTQLVTSLKVQIRTGKAGDYPGTNSNIYLEVYNGNSKDVWESVLLDKPNYDDFESGDNDTYIVPIAKYNYSSAETEAVSLDNLKIRIKNSGGDEWLISDMWITPYNGKLQLSDTFYIPDDTYLKNSSIEIVPKSYLKDSNYKKYSKVKSFEYETSLDSSLISYIRSIDGSAQWQHSKNILWYDITLRENVFFKIFKGFRPEINYTGTSTVEYNKPINMTITLDAFWNGIRDTRRYHVSDISRVPAVDGTVTVSFIKNNTVVSSVKKEVSNNKVYFTDYVDSKLIPGKYDIKINYDAYPLNPMHADTESTYMSKLTVKGAATDKNVINTVVIENVKTPMLGDNIKDYRKPTLVTEGVKFDSVGWYIYEKDSWYPMWYSTSAADSFDVFEKGKRYRIEITLKPNDTETVDSSFTKKREDMNVFINGQKAELVYNYSASRCVAALEFTVMEKPEFTVAPKGGEVAPGEKLTVNWKTNFEPTRLYVMVEDAERAIGLNLDQTSVDLVAKGDKYYMLCAFYADGEFVISEPFYVTEKAIEPLPEEKEEPKEEPVEDKPVEVKAEAVENSDTIPEDEEKSDKEETKPTDEGKSDKEETKPTDEEKKPEEAEVPEITIDNKFSDVKTSAWYYNDVLLAYQIGLINGKTATEYMPDNKLTYAEAIKLAACMHQLYTTGKVTLTNGAPWYQSYVDYCKENGIINQEYNYDDYATRAGYMTIFANALPDEALKAINDVPDNSIPDVPTGRNYSASVYKLYRAGILQGSDAAHNCKPLENIKRSEVAAILSRMMYAGKRVAITDMGK